MVAILECAVNIKSIYLFFKLLLFLGIVKSSSPFIQELMKEKNRLTSYLKN